MCIIFPSHWRKTKMKLHMPRIIKYKYNQFPHWIKTPFTKLVRFKVFPKHKWFQRVMGKNSYFGPRRTVFPEGSVCLVSRWGSGFLRAAGRGEGNERALERSPLRLVLKQTSQGTRSVTVHIKHTLCLATTHIHTHTRSQNLQTPASWFFFFCFHYSSFMAVIPIITYPTEFGDRGTSYWITQQYLYSWRSEMAYKLEYSLNRAKSSSPSLSPPL